MKIIQYYVVEACINERIRRFGDFLGEHHCILLFTTEQSIYTNNFVTCGVCINKSMYILVFELGDNDDAHHVVEIVINPRTRKSLYS